MTLLTIAEAAHLLRVPKSTAYSLCREGELPVVRIRPRLVRVDKAALEEIRVFGSEHSSACAGVT